MNKLFGCLSICFSMLFTGCPKCPEPFDLQLLEQDTELYGYWRGYAHPATGTPFPSSIYFDDSQFILDSSIPGYGSFHVEGIWATGNEGEWQRLDTSVGCSNVESYQNGSYQIWYYRIDGDMLSFAHDEDFINGIDDPNRQGTFYELNRIE